MLDTEDINILVEELGDSPSLTEVRDKFLILSPKLKTKTAEKLTPKKIHRKLKQIRTVKEKGSIQNMSSEVLPKKFWPKRIKKYSLKEYETVYRLLEGWCDISSVNSQCG